MESVATLEQVTPEWLTGRLKERGYLPAGRVTGVEQERAFSHNATSAQMALHYTAEADLRYAPERVFVKIARPGVPWNVVEFDFYTVVAAAMRADRPEMVWPFPRCYDAAYDERDQGAYLLLEDLSLSHLALDAPLPPTPDQAGQAIDGLAAFHAYWWEHQRLGGDIGRRHTAGSIAEMLVWAAGNFEKWADLMGPRLSAGRRQLLERIVEAWPARRRERLIQGQGITLVHRDTHPLNFLYPRDAGAGPARIVDWQSWRVDTGTDDLAYMMACHWYPEYRARLERPLLRRYHQALLAQGVGDYSWDDCWYDYQASIMRCLFFLVGGWQVERPASMWWQRVEMGLIAFEELGCEELLQEDES